MSEPMSESGSEPEASGNLPTSSSAVKREHSPSVPSSPPQTDEAQEDVKQSPSRKRSHDEMSVDVKGVIDASTISPGESDAITVKSALVKTQDSASTMASPAAPSTPPLPVQTLSDSSKMPPPSQIPLRSGQREPNGQTDKAKHSHSAAAIEQSNHSTDEAMSDEPISSFDGEPQDEIQDFDWVDLQQRYHDQMKQLDANEQEILQEFSSLCDYFCVWAQTGVSHEVDRSFKRLKTQMTLVQHHEAELEKKRQHYIKVVDAFKSALQLLAD